MSHRQSSVCIRDVRREKVILERAGNACLELASLTKAMMGDGIHGNMQSHPEIIWRVNEKRVKDKKGEMICVQNELMRENPRRQIKGRWTLSRNGRKVAGIYTEQAGSRVLRRAREEN